MWCWILWSPQHGNQGCRMGINYPLNDALTKPENEAVSCIAGMPHLKQLYSNSSVTARFQVRADYVVHLRICTRPSLLSILQWWKLRGRWEWGQHTYLHLMHNLWDTHNKCTYSIKESMYGHILRANCLVQSITHQCSTYQNRQSWWEPYTLSRTRVTQL